MSASAKSCISYGMPMRTFEEHALGDAAKPFCRYCCSQDGTLKRYDEVLDGMAGFLRRTQGLDDGVSRETAKRMMAKMPAWRER